MRRLILGLLMALILGLAAGVHAAGPVREVQMSAAEAAVNMADTLRLNARALPADADNRALYWSSSDKKIATVDVNGLVTPIAPGTVNIAATAADGSGARGITRVTVTRVYRRALVLGATKGNRRLGTQPLAAVGPEIRGVARAMKVSRFADGYGINVSYALNRTKKQVKAAIQKKFRAAKDDDVSYVYLSGHGMKQAGEFYLLPCLDAMISAEELKRWLDPIPGTVVLVVNTCFSGSIVSGKGAGADSGDFGSGFVDRFLSPPAQGKSTAITGAKYQVICATAGNETGWTYYDGYDYVKGKRRYRYADAFGTPFAAGIGWDYLDGAGVRSWLADYNFDGEITGRELYAYLRLVVGRQDALRKVQTVTVYPSGGSDFVLFAQ